MSMNSDDFIPVQIKANRDGFILVLDPDPSFQAILDYMEERLNESHDFFQHSEMILDLRARPLGTEEILALRQLLDEKAAVKLVEIKLREDVSFMLNRKLDQHPPPPRKRAALSQDVAPMIVRSTCRSGTRIESAADCVILGDVNPGAEVIAAGDIIVFGSLRGVAHAGATGDHTARIWALSIEPHQIRIADRVAVPPGGDKPTPKRFEVAFIRNGTIQVVTS